MTRCSLLIQTNRMSLMPQTLMRVVVIYNVSPLSWIGTPSRGWLYSHSHYIRICVCLLGCFFADFGLAIGWFSSLMKVSNTWIGCILSKWWYWASNVNFVHFFLQFWYLAKFTIHMQNFKVSPPPPNGSSLELYIILHRKQYFSVVCCKYFFSFFFLYM